MLAFSGKRREEDVVPDKSGGKGACTPGRVRRVRGPIPPWAGDDADAVGDADEHAREDFGSRRG